MSMIAFFPWLSVEEEITLGKFSLLPFTVGEENGFGIPKDLNRIAAAYRVTPKGPVQSVCVLKIAGKDVDADLDDDERNEIFKFAEILSLSAIADRRYFSHSGYDTNHDTYSLVIQSFQTGKNGFAIESRRKDGTNLGYWPDENFMVIKPSHAHQSVIKDPNKNFIEGLLLASNSEKWEPFDSSMFYFNRANSDASNITLQSEVIQSISAFEALFEVKSGKEEDLSNAFSKCLSIISEDFSCEISSRLEVQDILKKYPSIRELWVRDMYRTRNSFAHGSKTRKRTPAIWNTQEHLLLASFIFPVCLKLKLLAAGFYKSTDDDFLKVFTFDRLIRLQNIFSKTEKSGTNEAKFFSEWVWQKIVRNAVFEWPATRAFPKI